MVKAFVGDMYLCNHALLTEIPENVRNNSLTYMESDCFGTEELAFIGSLGFLVQIHLFIRHSDLRLMMIYWLFSKVVLTIICI